MKVFCAVVFGKLIQVQKVKGRLHFFETKPYVPEALRQRLAFKIKENFSTETKCN